MEDLRETKLPTHLGAALSTQTHISNQPNGMFPQWIRLVQEVQKVIFTVHTQCPACKRKITLKNFVMDSGSQAIFTCQACRNKQQKAEVFLKITRHGQCDKEKFKLYSPIIILKQLEENAGDDATKANAEFWFGGEKPARDMLRGGSQSVASEAVTNSIVFRRYKKHLPDGLITQALCANG